MTFSAFADENMAFIARSLIGGYGVIENKGIRLIMARPNMTCHV
jgi:hypothetical protein